MTIIRNVCLLFGLSIFAIYVNFALQSETTNFMFIARSPFEGLPILNLNYAWYGNYVKFVVFAVVALTIFHTPFILVEKKEV